MNNNYCITLIACGHDHLLTTLFNMGSFDATEGNFGYVDDFLQMENITESTFRVQSFNEFNQFANS